jgi:hypothetical protein
MFNGGWIMRTIGMLVISGALILMSVAWVEGQIVIPGGGKGGFGGGPQSPLSLLNRSEVKKELNVTDEQLEKLSPEVMAAIAKVLDEKQFKRFKQIDLQQRGNNAFRDVAVQKELKFTDDQKMSIVSLLNDSDKEIKALMPKFGAGGKGTDFKAAFEKIDNARKETKEKIFTVLTKDQRKTYREMIGEEFKFQQPGGGQKKKDAQ